MKANIPDGIFPTMLTPFNMDYSIDYNSLERLVQWYEMQGVNGLFAVCQSSAMFELSSRERKELCKNVVDMADGKYPVVASGHVSDTLDDQICDLADMAEAGAAALVLVSNRLAGSNEPDSLWHSNIEYVMERLPQNIPLGFYECPYPYKRLLSIDQIKWMIGTGRFSFIKDTCCNPQTIAERGAAVKGTSLKLYNANAATFLYSLRCGYSGYSGVMTNFHADLYCWLFKNWRTKPREVAELQDYLGIASVIEYQAYPMNAKYSLVKDGIFSTAICRRSDARGKSLTPSQEYEVNQFRALSGRFSSIHSDI